MKTSTKFLLTAAFIGSLGFGGLAKVVYAKQSKSAIAVMPQNQSKTQIAEASDGDGEVPDATEAQAVMTNKTQIAEASDGDGEVADKVEERQETTRLQALAKITPQQAQQAAQAAIGGTARSVKLDEEDGNLVYKVKIAQTEAAVDAGNGKVLYTEKDNQEDNAATEAKRPRSSIQVPRENDGDKEVNDDVKM
ncbi:MAG: PepSY domain-containing protein [Coleofasciculaceae cyanobacterium]